MPMSLQDFVRQDRNEALASARRYRECYVRGVEGCDWQDWVSACIADARDANRLVLALR